MSRLTLLLAVFVLSALPVFAANAQPNVIVILTDDLGWGDLSCYPKDPANPDVAMFTPHLDSLASQGVRFTQAYAQTMCSPRALDDLLADGPDAPQFTTFCYASKTCRLFLNSREVPSARQEPADYRTRYQFERLPLRKGWNHLLVKVASSELSGEHPGTLAVRITSNNHDYLRQIESSVEADPGNLK